MSIREEVLNNIEETLAGITIANGYNTDLTTVTQSIENIDKFEVSEFPVAIISYENDDKDTEDIAPDYLGSVLTALIACGIYSTDDKLSILEKLLVDIEKAMCLDQTRGGIAAYTIPSDITLYANLEKENFLYATVKFLIRYYYRFGNP